jgi:hypothetical protein
MKTAREKTGRKHFMAQSINDSPAKVKASLRPAGRARLGRVGQLWIEEWPRKGGTRKKLFGKGIENGGFGDSLPCLEGKSRAPRPKTRGTKANMPAIGQKAAPNPCLTNGDLREGRME